MLLKLIPKIFYDKMSDALDLFVEGLQFKVLYQDAEMAVVERDGAKAYLVESAEYAAKDRPEIGIDVDNIDELYREVSSRRPDLLHPNSRTVSKRPWGSREFAVLDKTTVCVVFRQWD